MLRPSNDRTRYLTRALVSVWESGPGWMVASLALMVVQGLLPLAALYLTKLAIDVVTGGLTAPDPGVPFDRLAGVIALSAVVALAVTACSTLSRLVGSAQAQAVSDHLQTVLHAKSIEVDLEYYENPLYYDTMHRAQNQAAARPARVVSGLIQVGQSGVSLLAIVGLLFAFHWGAGVVVGVSVLPSVLVRLRYARTMHAWARQRTPDERKTWYIRALLTQDTHAKEVRLFGLGPLLLERFRKLRRRLSQERLALNARRAAAELAAEAPAVGAVYVLFALMGYRTLQGALTVGDLVMYFQAIQRGQSFLRSLTSSLSDLYESRLFLAHLYEFLDLERKVAEPTPEPVPVPRPLRQGIVFDHVTFQYPGSERRVLDDITLTIRPGEHVAFVGENGAGKTTLIKLLCRLYDPSEGAITLDGIDLRRFETAALRREIGVIFQDYARYHLPAWENIWLGDVDRPPDRDQIAAAARAAGADEVISRLKHGYDTNLGKWFGDGAELSVGEWQKVALARAFLRDAQILVMDEPTSAMDARAEADLFQRFHQLAQGRTALLISHRLSAVKMADRIYVLETGRIVESGTHDELLSRNGRYATLFETQASHYR